MENSNDQCQTTMPENYFTSSCPRFLPENNHPTFPVFEPSNLEDSLLADFNSLNLSMPHHESVGAVETLVRSRAQSAARAQYRNSYSSLFAREFGSTYDEYLPNNQHRFTGQPEPMYSPNSWISSWPSPNQSGLFRESMYVTNGPNGSPFSSRPSLDFARPIQPQVKDFRGEIKWIARNRYGSSLLKHKIEVGVEEDLELIFEELKDDVVGLMVNYFGNNVIQKLFKVCRPEQINYMLRLLLQNNFQFAQICCDNHGSLAMEKLLQSLSTRDQRSTVVSALSGFVLMLSNDQNGHKVVDYCICNFPENIDVLINAIADNCFEIATHKIGCRVLQCYLDIAVGEMMQCLMGQLGCYAVLLSAHPYGNYVVQYLLDKKNPSIRNKILGRLAENFVSLSMDKCGSNVVEKCLICASEDEATRIIFEIISSDDFLMVLQDPFGNYVVQKALEVSQKMPHSEIRGILEDRIMSFSALLQTHPYGNRVLSKLQHLPRPF